MAEREAAEHDGAERDGAEQQMLEQQRALEQQIRALLASRASTSTICPSDVARAMTSDETEWRALMEPVRQAARRMVAAGEVQITQGGRVVDPSTLKGPIRIRWSR